MTADLYAVLGHGAKRLQPGVSPERRCEWIQKRRFVMRDILPDVERWRERGERVAIATVVSMAGSAPRRPGAKLAVSESGKPQMLEFGISEEDNFEKIGLACGGTIHVFVERLDW